MKLIILPKSSFRKPDIKNLKKIVFIAERLLKKNNISIPKKIYFYNSFREFIKKVLPEVKNYGFNSIISEEIIKCALNNGTYGTLSFKEDSIIEMNFNPFNKGEYSSTDFLKLIIHESLHLYLSKKIKRDINFLKFKFSKGKFIGNQKIIQFDEGYAEFMTKKILKDFNTSVIKRIRIPAENREKPKYNVIVGNIDIKSFDINFENLLISNRNIGFQIFSKKFNEKAENKDILRFAIDKLKSVI